MISAMKLILELSAHAPNIYEFLDKADIKAISSGTALREECRKAGLIISFPQEPWEEAFIAAEQHPFLAGAVDFMITENMTLDDFKHRTQMADMVFSQYGVSEEYRKNGHLFLRAIISMYKDHNVLRRFSDSGDKEEAMKKMLASDLTAKTAVCGWLSLKTKKEFDAALEDAVLKDSQRPSFKEPKSWYPALTAEAVKRAHEALYKDGDLQDWIHQQNAYRFDWGYDGHLYISRPNSWYDWIMLDTKRNEFIETLLQKGFKCSCRAVVGKKELSYFYGGKNTPPELDGQQDYDGLKFIFEGEGVLKVLCKTDNQWKTFPKLFNYVEQENTFMETLEKEILAPYKQDPSTFKAQLNG